MENSFKWVAHTTKKADKRGHTKIELPMNQRISIELATSCNYELELHEIINGEEKIYKKNSLCITETEAFKIVNEDNKDKKEKIPDSYFQSRYKWIFSSVCLDIKSRYVELLPILLWGMVLPLVCRIFNVYPSHELAVALNLLIKQNASEVTVLIAGVGFSFFSVCYLWLPKGSKIEKTVLVLVNQFFGLIIGASSFGIASILLTVLMTEQSVEMAQFSRGIFLPLFICALAFGSLSFFKEINIYLKVHDRLILAGITIVILLFLF